MANKRAIGETEEEPLFDGPYCGSQCDLCGALAYIPSGADYYNCGECGAGALCPFPNSGLNVLTGNKRETVAEFKARYDRLIGRPNVPFNCRFDAYASGDELTLTPGGALECTFDGVGRLVIRTKGKYDDPSDVNAAEPKTAYRTITGKTIAGERVEQGDLLRIKRGGRLRLYFDLIRWRANHALVKIKSKFKSKKEIKKTGDFF